MGGPSLSPSLSWLPFLPERAGMAPRACGAASWWGAGVGGTWSQWLPVTPRHRPLTHCHGAQRQGPPRPMLQSTVTPISPLSQ